MATAKHAKGFVDFVREQGVVGLAVGLAIGTAAGAAVKEIVDQFIPGPQYPGRQAVGCMAFPKSACSRT
jgi:large-conductance mechanosensitive channel